MLSEVTNKSVRILLSSIYGESWKEDPNMQGTPERMVKMYSELLEYSDSGKREEAIKECFEKSFPSIYDNMIFKTGIETVSMCPHHFLPVEYTMTIAYIPSSDGMVVGASKLERIARILSKRAVLQETLTHEIASTFWSFLQPQGVAVVVSGIHGCMKFRGIKSPGSFETSEMKGSFRDNPDTRMEFFQLLNNVRK